MRKMSRVFNKMIIYDKVFLVLFLDTNKEHEMGNKQKYLNKIILMSI